MRAERSQPVKIAGIPAISRMSRNGARATTGLQITDRVCDEEM